MTLDGATGRYLVVGLAVAGGLMVLAAAGVALWQAGGAHASNGIATEAGLDDAGPSSHMDGNCGAPLAALRLSGFFSGQHDEDPAEEVLLRLVAEGDDAAYHVFCGTLNITVDRIDYGADGHNYTLVHSTGRHVTAADFVDPYASRGHDWYLSLLLDDDVFPTDAHYRVNVALALDAGGRLEISETVIYGSDGML